MTESPESRRWRPPPGWPPPAPGWAPPAGWQPDPAWPPAPEDWAWWEPGARSGPSRGRPWFVAAGVMLPLAFVLLVLGLLVPSLALVYLSVLSSIVWVPLLIVGLVRRSTSRTS